MTNRMAGIAETHGLVGPHQFGFKKNRSTVDAVFLLTALLKKAKAKNLPFSAAFIDVSKVRHNHHSSHTTNDKMILGIQLSMA